MINVFFPDVTEMKSVSLQLRILRNIIAYKANYMFANVVIDRLVKRNPNYRDDANEKCKVDGHLANRNTAFEGMYRLGKIYESEWGVITPEIQQQIEDGAKALADIALEKFGWNK